MPFKLVSENQPKGDQPQALEKLFKGLKVNKRSHLGNSNRDPWLAD